jgi:hypothetical protein
MSQVSVKQLTVKLLNKLVLERNASFLASLTNPANPANSDPPVTTLICDKIKV